MCLLSGSGIAGAAGCEEWSAEVVVAEGVVEVRRAGQAAWTPVRRGDRICQEEPVRSGRNSRAAFALPGDTLARLGEEGAVTFTVPEDDELTWLDVLRGMILVISRDSRALKVTTPFGDAGLEGTEFLVDVDAERLDLTVFEGTVSLENERFGARAVSGSRRIVVDAAGFGEMAAADPAQRELLWALHYEPVIDGVLPAPDASLPGLSPPAGFYARRAQSRLLAGRVEAAVADVDAALTTDPGDPQALAVAAMIARAERERGVALARVDRALTRDPEAAGALIAAAYLLEDEGRYREAIVRVRAAIGHEPGNLIARVRLAELLLAARDLPNAVRAAEEVLSRSPRNAAAFNVLGFAAMAGGDTGSARERFSRSIEENPSAPLPRLGLAIALIRAGERGAAIDQLENAVALDPNNGAVRSYMAKAYFDDYESELATAQLEISKRVDSDDATPYSYRAQLLLETNDTIAAFKELAAAEALAGRLPFGSTFAFDDDPAMRNASRGQIFRSINYEQLAQLDAAESLFLKPSDAGAHWLLADVVSEIPGQQITRISETRQARMQQAVNTMPTPPQLGLVNLHVMDSAGATELSRLQPRSSFVRNGLQTQVAAVTAGNGTRGQDVMVSGTGDRLSFDFGYGSYESDGFRENNDLRHEVGAAFIQSRVGPRTSVLTEVKSVRTEKGDLPLLFNEDIYSPLARQMEEDDSVMVGFATNMASSSKLLGSLTLGSLDLELGIGEALLFDTTADRGILDLQYLRESPNRSLVAGLRVMSDDQTDSFTAQVPVGDPPMLTDITNLTTDVSRHRNSYLYVNQQLGERFYLTAGGALSSIESAISDRRRFNPKLGLMWRAPDTIFRVAYFETLQGPQIAKQLIQPLLEPTLVSGFSQFVFGVEGEVARNYAVAADHALTPDIRIAAEHRERSLESPFVMLSPGSAEILSREFNIRESIDALNLYWTPTGDVAVRAGWMYENYDYHGEVSPFQFTELRTRRLPIEVTWLVGELLSVQLSGTRIRQAGIFDGPGPTTNLGAGDSRFSVFDASVNFRLPRRRGTIELGIRNLFDESFRFQDTDPENPRIFPERFLLTRFSLLF